MYKVFVNEKVICFTKAVENFDAFENALILRFFHKELSEFLIDLLLNGKRIETIFIVVDKPDMAFEQFQLHFKMMDAAGGLVKNAEGAYLFIHRLFKWDLPKGKLEKGESPEEGAMREVEEECGVNGLSISKELTSTYHIYELKGEMVLKRTHWFEMETAFQGDLIPQVEEQITAVKWMTKSEIGQLVLTNTYASLLDIIRKVIS